MIKFVSGDILRTKAAYIAHGVGTDSHEGAATGLALRISSKWPDVQKHFRQFTRSQQFKVGDIFVVAPTRNRPGIIYIATQPDINQESLSSLNRGLRKLARYCVKHRLESVALPKIGADRGELDWEESVTPLLDRHLADLETSFFIHQD
jgi:O-acetyl-ADP-ribose deacetylase (regulator of RNase III)